LKILELLVKHLLLPGEDCQYKAQKILVKLGQNLPPCSDDIPLDLVVLEPVLLPGDPLVKAFFPQAVIKTLLECDRLFQQAVIKTLLECDRFFQQAVIKTLLECDRFFKQAVIKKPLECDRFFSQAVIKTSLKCDRFFP